MKKVVIEEFVNGEIITVKVVEIENYGNAVNQLAAKIEDNQVLIF